MSDYEIDQAEQASLASQVAESFVGIMMNGTSMDPDSGRGKVLARIDQGAAFASGGLVFMGLLSLLLPVQRDPSINFPLDDLLGATLTDPMDTIEYLASLTPSLAVLAAGLLLFALQVWTLASQFTASKVHARYVASFDDPSWLVPTVAPFRRAIIRYAGVRPGLMAGNAALFAILAWFLTTVTTWLPGWITVLVIWFGHMAVSHLINKLCTEKIMQPQLTAAKEQIYRRVHWALSTQQQQ